MGTILRSPSFMLRYASHDKSDGAARPSPFELHAPLLLLHEYGHFCHDQPELPDV